MVAAILNSAILDSAILNKTLTQTNSIWLKLIHSHLTWWWQPFGILPSWIQPFWHKLIQSDSNSFILTQLDDGSHLVICHVGFRHDASLDSDTLLPSLRFTPKHSHSNLTLNQTNSIWLKLIHSDINLMMAAIFNSSHLEFSYSCTKLWLKLIQSDSNSFILIQLDDANHLEFCQLDSAILQRINFKLIHSDFNLMMAAIFNSAMLDSATTILDSDTLLSSIRFAQKHSHSNLTLTQTNSIWLKLIHSHLTWWWQPSWVLPTWIPPYWIQPS